MKLAINSKEKLSNDYNNGLIIYDKKWNKYEKYELMIIEID